MNKEINLLQNFFADFWYFKNNQTTPVCNLFIERPSYIVVVEGLRQYARQTW